MLKLSLGLVVVDYGLLISQSFWMHTVGIIRIKTKSEDAS